MLLTSLIFVDFVEELHPLHGERPPAYFQFSGTGVVAALQPVNNLGRRGDH